MATFDDYKPLFPIDRPADEKLENFVSHFYVISDDASRDEEWVNSFLPDATVIIGDKLAVGIENIRRMRKGMWEGVRTRRHKPLAVYLASFQPEASKYQAGERPDAQYMIEGTLVSTHANDETRELVWAARAVLREDAGVLKYKLYQVYLHKKPEAIEG
ncbi:hypothetical protein F5Y11DRAFT_349670 [Daldinia sp. FL1419]|nr:hypothetical protein F5Y11DRAFT_349670 [Daldinia sp. FL1419]